MKSKGRNLRVHMKGDDVRALQRALRQLDFEIDAEELENRRFGKSTSRAVRAFKEAYQLEATSEVDEETANLIRDLVVSRRLHSRDAIRGVVLFAPEVDRFSGVRIEAFADADLEQRVGHGLSNERGQFVIVPDRGQRTGALQSGPLWFRWTYLDARGRTPKLDPWSPGTALRLPLYEPSPIKREIERRSSLQGRVTTVSGSPAASLGVWLVEQTVRHCRHLASGVTQADGSYRLVYDAVHLLHSDRPDLRTLVFDGEDVALTESRAAEITVPDETVAVSWTGDPAVQQAFRIALDRDETQPVRPEDVDYLIQRGGVSGRAAALLRRAASLSKATRIDIPTALAIESAGPDAHMADVVAEGVGAGWIDPDLVSDVDKLDTVVMEQRERERRGLAADQGPLQDVLEARLPDETLRLDVTKIWLNSQRDPEQFKARIGEHPELSSQADEIRFTIEVAEHVERNLELVRALERCFDADDKVQKPEDLAAWGISKWRMFIETENIAIPDGFQGDGDRNDSARKFAVHLRNKFEHIYPGRATREHFLRNASSYKWGEAVRALLEERTDIDPSIPVPKLEREHPELFEREDAQLARHGLATFQRLRRLTGNIDPIQPLVHAGLGSARDIEQTDPDAFAERFGAAFSDSGADAAIAHIRATRIASLAKLTYYELSDQFNQAPLAVLSPELSEEQTKTLATWRDLFGSEDLGFCECAHCKSIFGPAAYLFDMLLFLDRFAGPFVAPGVIWCRIGGTNHVVTMAAADGKLFAVTSDSKLWMREAVAADNPWTPIGQANDVVALAAIDGKLFAATSDNKLLMREAVATRIPWTDIGQADRVVALAAVDGKLFAATSDNKLLTREAVATDCPWTDIGQADGVVAMTAMDGKLLAATNENELWMREAVATDSPWTPIGSANHAVAMAAIDGMLFAAIHNNELCRCEAVAIDVSWTHIGSANDMVAMAAMDGKLFAVSSDNKLWMRGAAARDIPWTDIGQADGVVAIAAMDGKFFAVTSDSKLWMREAVATDSPWTHIGQADRVVAMAAMDGKLFAATSNSKLLMCEVVATDCRWIDIGHARDVVAMTAVDGKLFAAASDGKLLMREAVATHIPWTHIGSADDAVAMAATDGMLFIATSNNELWMREAIATDIPWTHIGTADYVTAMAAMDGNLFGVTSDKQLWKREAAAADIPWTPSGSANHAVAIASDGNRLYVATRDNNIWMRHQIVIDDMTGMTRPVWVRRGQISLDPGGFSPHVITMAAGSDTVDGITDGVLIVATSENEIWMCDLAAQDWHWICIGDTLQVVAMAVIDGKLLATTSDKRLWMQELASASRPWTDIGLAKNMIAIAATDGELFTVTNDNKLWMREAAATDHPWTHIGQADHVVAMAAVGGRLFAATSNNRLLMREAVATDRPWTDIGQAKDLVAMAAMDGKLFAVSSDNKLWMHGATARDIRWTNIGHANDVVAIAAMDGKLFATTSDNKLWMREAVATRIPWTPIGHANHAVTMAAVDGKLFAVSSDKKLWMQELTPASRPWTYVGSTDRVVAMTAMGGKLFAVTNDPELWMCRLSTMHLSANPTLLDALRRRRPDVPALTLSCDNTNIEVPHIDLVNETLSDLVEKSTCLGIMQNATTRETRSTTGTSEERRAWPEHEPSEVVLTELATAAHPWTLPYDYEQDRADQARSALSLDGNKVVEAVWEFERLSNDTGTVPSQSAVRSLACYALNLTRAELELIANPAPDVQSSWGDEVSGMITSGKSPSVAALERAGRFEFAELEDALETRFVRQATTADKIGLWPANTCDTEQLRLAAPLGDLAAILDRVHRFERLRRKTGWSANQLDNVLVALNLELGEDALLVVGLLVYLQQRLRLDPDAVVALFQDPASGPPFTLRPDKRVLSAFQRLFGTEPVDLPTLDGDDTDSMNVADSVVATIAQRIGVGHDEVRFVLSKGYAAINGTAFTDPLAILNANDPRAAWRAAVASVFRVTTFASALDLSLSDFIALVELSGTSPLLRGGAGVVMKDLLIDAVSFIALAHHAATWPLPPSEVLYHTTTDAAARRTFAPDAVQAGILLQNLQSEIRRVLEASGTAGAEAGVSVRDALAELFAASESQSDGGASALQSAIERTSRLIEWSSVFPDLKAQAIASLPAGAVLDNEVPDPDLNERNQANDAIPELLLTHLEQITDSTGVDETSTEYSDALQALQDEIEAIVRDPSSACVERLASELEPLLGLILTGIPDDELGERSQEIASTLLSASINAVTRYQGHDTGNNKWYDIDGVRACAAQRWLPVLSTAVQRRKADAAVIDFLASAYALNLSDARLLLTQSLRDPDYDQPLLRAFVARNGSAQRLDASLIETSYTNLATRPPDAQFNALKIEPSLQLDWTASPPPAGIDPEQFCATLTTFVRTVNLQSGPDVRRVVVESTGLVTMTLHSGTDQAPVQEQVLEMNAAGCLQQQEWDTDAVAAFLAASSPQPDEVKMELTFSTAPAEATGGVAVLHQPPVLRVLVQDEDGELVPLDTGMLTNALVRLDKAARVFRALSLPVTIWPMLSTLSNDRRVDLNDLPIASGRAFDLWQRAISLERIWKRHREEGDIAALQAIIAGSPISVELLACALGLTSAELRSVLRLFEIELASDQKRVSPPSNWPILDAALRLSDLARGAGLPLGAILGWTNAPADDFYRWALGALRALRPEEEWFEVLQHIHDPVREHLRDALVAWLVTHPRIGDTGIEHPPFATPEAISDYLLTDVQMSACMVSSRVQFGYAAVQRYIDAIRLGFEPGPKEAEAQERFEREWSWRRFYRLWEANRRVFVYPENWLEPDLRPDKSVFFQELEEELLEGPLTTASAERALANYLGKLVDVARPEIIGIVHEGGMPDSTSPTGFRDPDLQGTHVFARSRSEPHQLYYRRRLPTDHRWTPWERIDAELPGTHFVSVIAFRRLYLFSAQFGSGRPDSPGCNCNTTSNRVDDPRQIAHVEISWIERRHGRWSPVRRGAPISFDVSQVQTKGTDVGEWAGFPDDVFEAVTHHEPKLATADLNIKVGDDGMDPNRLGAAFPECTTLKVYLQTRSEGFVRICIPYAEDDINGWPNYEEKSFPCTIEPELRPSDIIGLGLTYHGAPPAGGDAGDACYIEKVEIQFYTSSGDSYGKLIPKSVKRRFPEAPADNRRAESTELIDLRGSLPQDPERTYTYLHPEIQDFFEPEIEYVDWEPPPSEVFAFHATSPDQGGEDSILLHLTVHDEIKVCRHQRRKFEFTEAGFDYCDEHNIPEIRSEWPTGFQLGTEQCVEQLTIGMPLQCIEIFADGTIRSSSEAGDDSTRGEYEYTEPCQQFFRAETLSPKPFYTDYQHALTVKQPYQVCVPSEGHISSAVGPKTLDEISSLNEGRTFFTEYVMRWSPPVYWSGWVFRVFWHPQAVGFLRLLQAHGVPRLLAHEAQTLADSALSAERDRVEFFEEEYDPKPIVVDEDEFEYPEADVDFSIKGAYADYNWELFFHAPLLIAQRLSEAGQFEDADRWFRLLFDPTKGRLNQKPLESFQTRPLREAIAHRFEDMLYLLDDHEIRFEFKQQVDRLNRFPYQPHLIARTRWSAYQKTLVMKYLDHLIAWADELFRRAYATDNRTELENAASRYDFAAKLLGRRPEVLPSQARSLVSSYDALSANKDTLDVWDALDLWDPLVRMENYIPLAITAPSILPSMYGNQAVIRDFIPVEVPNDGEGIPELLYFCVPHNKDLLGYWDTLADRLMKLRSCRDIEGVRRMLSLYGRQIDPGLLVRATAMGLDIDIVLGYLSAPTPRFRFNVLLQRARSACDRAHSFGQALLSAIEKRESEELARLRSRHELDLLRASKRVRDEQVGEARESLEALFRSRESAVVRYQYYVTRQRLNVQEAAEGEALEQAVQNERLAAAAAAAAADLAFVPNSPISQEAIAEVFSGGGSAAGSGYRATLRASGGNSYDFGGQFLSKLQERKALGHRHVAEQNRAQASRLGRQAQYDRRWEDWQLQKELAEKDIEQIDRQIASAEIRLRIAEIEQENQLLQIDQTATIDAYLRDKFTNAKLYRWMESRLSRLYYQQYRMSYDLALKTQHALRYELGLDDESLLPDTWDPSRRGMEAAGDLQHELEKMETRYLDAWRREHEKQKVFSLADRWPLAFLELRQTGRCVIQIRESDLDEDEPGDYFRRIKQVSVDIPCVRGPYVSVNARLTLLRSETRIKPHIGGDYSRAPGLDGANDMSFRDDAGGVEHIVTSTGVNDTGQFDSNLGGERLAPFEGAGVISTWQIDLPIETNRFARSTISDVVLRILYTARDGGDTARVAALQARQDNLGKQGRSVMLPLATYFSSAWSKFTNQQSEQRELELQLKDEHLPYGLEGWTVSETTFYFEVEFEEDDGFDTDPGEPDWPLDLPGIARLALETPISLGEDLSLTTFTSETAVFKKGWVLLLVKPG